MRLIPAFFSVCFFCLASFCGAADGFEFRINGNAFIPNAIHFEQKNSFSEGDLIAIGRTLMVLGRPGVYDFKTTPSNDGRILRVMPDGSESVAAFHITYSYKDKKENFQRFNDLSDEDISSLSGIYIECWSGEIAEKLKHINPLKICVTLSNYAGIEKSKILPPLPAALQYLCISESSSDGLRDFSSLSILNNLKFFSITTLGETPFDAKLIAGNKNLQSLDLHMNSKIMNPAFLGNLTELKKFSAAQSRIDDISFVANMKELKTLKLSWSSVKDISACAKLDNLEELDISRTGVTDLTPLASLKSLRKLMASSSLVSKLPETQVPNLTEIWLFSTMLEDADVNAFTALNPQCRKVYFKYYDSLKTALGEADTLKVRTFGPRSKKILELTSSAEIKELIDNMKVIDPKTMFSCACAGDPFFDFYKNGKLIETVSFHHGHSLRWKWGSDAALEEPSAEYLCNFLAKHGWNQAALEREKNKLQEQALQRRIKLYRKIFPEKSLTVFLDLQHPGKLKEEFEKLPGTPVEKTTAAFRLLDCDDCSWNLQCNTEKAFAEFILPSLDKSTVIEAVKYVAAKEGINGAARWIFFLGGRVSYDKSLLDEILPSLAEAGLSHPRKINRIITMNYLSKAASPAAKDLLKKCFNEEIKIRSLAPENISEPAGFVSYSPATAAPENVSEWAMAAAALLKLGDTSIIPALREKLVNASGTDKKFISEHLKE